MVADGWALDAGLLLLRLLLGLILVAHGCDKFFGKGGIRGRAAWFESIGMRPGLFNAATAASIEILAGAGLALGVLNPIPAAGFVALMLVAIWTAQGKNGFFVTRNGWEYNLVLAVVAIGIATIGAGRLSVDWLLLRGTGVAPFLDGWWGLLLSAGLGVLGGLGQLALFYRPPARAASRS